MLEGEYHRMASGSALRTFIFPRACLSDADSSRVCGEGFRWGFQDPGRHRQLTVAPVLGYENRYAGALDNVFGLGTLASGFTGPLSFYLDARMFTVLRGHGSEETFDREPVDRQDEEASGSIAYESFSRYRSNLSYDWTWGRLTVSRDAAHWGPGLLNNLVFHQDAIPFDQATFTTRLGPVNVQSLYGRLKIEGDRIFNQDPHDRSLYAHRYEWNATNNLLLGISEQMIAYDRDEPFAVVPLVPLFISKGEGFERMNNANLAGDASYRLPGLGSVYSEFLIDDIVSPTSLFSHDWGNKWAWMCGLHGIGRIIGMDFGGVAEYVRIEPWVYTHYRAATAQSANMGYPLGNQLGPNAQAANLKAYVRADDKWYLSARLDLAWKGGDPGSSLSDEFREEFQRKEFLRGIGSPEVRVRSEGSWRVGPLLLRMEAGIGEGGFNWSTGVQARG